MRGRSYSLSPPRGGYSRRRRSPSPRRRYGGRDRNGPTSLLVRNLRRDCRPDDLRRPFSQFGPLKDIYLPRDYYTGDQSSNESPIEDDVKNSEDWEQFAFDYIVKMFMSSTLEELLVALKIDTSKNISSSASIFMNECVESLLALCREPRGFGFVQYVDSADAADAKYRMDGQVFHGRELTVVFAAENRKKPGEMRTRERDQSSNESPIEDDVKNSEDWEQFAFDYIVKMFMSSTLEELLVALKIDTSKNISSSASIFMNECVESLLALCREPRGFGFVQYVDSADAADAKYRMDGQVFHGRELTVVFAAENRKKPGEMRTRESRSRSFDRRRSSACYSRSPRYSRSPPRRRSRSRSDSRDYSPSPQRRQHLRSESPIDRKHSRERSYSQESRGRSYSRSPPSYNNSRSRSPK